MGRTKVIKILLAIIVIISIATVVTYFIYAKEKQWVAFYIACCGGVLVVNLILSIIFVNKNFRDKR